MEPVTFAAGASVLAESAGALKAALEAVPAGGTKRRTHQAQRAEAYNTFQRGLATTRLSTFSATSGGFHLMASSGSLARTRCLPVAAMSRTL